MSPTENAEVSGEQQPSAPDQPVIAAPSSSDGQFMITQVSTWISNADTKAGLLLTALAIAGGAWFTSLKNLSDELVDARRIAALVVLILAGAWLVVSIYFVVRVLVPRTSTPPTMDLWYSWPWLAQLDITAMPLRGGAPGDDDGAWIQAVVLAKIARDKFRAFRSALLTAVVGSVLMLVSSVIGI